MSFKLICLTILAAFLIQINANTQWTYKCISKKCQKERVTGTETPVSLSVCQLKCDDFASIWPKPTGEIAKCDSVSPVNIYSIDMLLAEGSGLWESDVRELVQGAKDRFKNMLEKKAGEATIASGGKTLEIYLKLRNDKTNKIVYNGDESYEMNINLTSDGRINSNIIADNFFGARNGLETLSQIIVFDDNTNNLVMLDNISIKDAPVYKHRGILLDTARNFVSKKVIKNTIEGMAMSKLNVFHWHITDSQSFPYVSKSVPELSQLGAYTPSKVYTAADIQEIIEFAKIRGVKVLPEFDAPAHVGEGWQDTGVLACFNKKPWQSYCVEPPCGQLDPTNEKVYEIIELIYKDMIEQFDPDVFHMGGDEVNENCWQSEQKITDWMEQRNISIDEAGFMQLWDHFQSQALERFRKQRGYDVPIIMWTSTLTKPEYLTKYLPNDTYIIQIWTKGDDPQIASLLKNGYRTILSNYEALYLDCGMANWVGNGLNWCAPYIGWQTVYDNSPAKIAGPKYAHLMMGAEATLWTEQTDDSSVGVRLWPRAAAMAERLWSEPGSWKEAEERMLIHRERLASVNIAPDMLEPEWCRKYQGSCPLDGVHNQEL